MSLPNSSVVTASYLETIFSLKGRKALVTGSSSGIGQAIALAYARAGASVAIHGTNPEKLAATSDLFAECGCHCACLNADLTDVAAAQELADQADTLMGGLDILVNCAGVNRRKPIAEMTVDDYDSIMAVNLRSIYFLSQATHQIMRRMGSGKIINIGSMTSFIGLADVSIYGASKAALGELTKTMALEWAEYNIQVNCLAPGFIRTPLTESGVWADPKKASWILNRVAARRAGTPEDLVGTALLLASAASNYLTGQIIAVDGGFLAGGSWARDPS